MPQQHIVPAITVEIADTRHRPIQIACQAREAVAAGDMLPTVHRVVVLTAILVPQQHIVAAIAVEVADAPRQH